MKKFFIPKDPGLLWVTWSDRPPPRMLSYSNCLRGSLTMRRFGSNREVVILSLLTLRRERRKFDDFKDTPSVSLFNH